MNKEFQEGNIVKKDLTSREAWVVEIIDGKFMGIPLINSVFKDETIVEITDEFTILPEFRGRLEDLLSND
jgi:hypothetical protein